MGKLNESIVAFREALEERTLERVPLDWAATQNNLGNALARIGERESDTGQLEAAVAAYREALKEWTQERVLAQWAMITGNQGVAMMVLAGRKEDGAMAKTALAQIEVAFETACSGGHAQLAANYAARLPEIRAILDRLQAR
jgi:tetratricopeptide (TPR) repeat protein